MPLGMEVGLGPCQFSAYVCCGQTAGWTKIPLAREVHVGLGDKSGARVGLTDGERGAANKVARQAFLRLFVERALFLLPSAPIGYVVF